MQKLAIAGGQPVRQAPLPPWPHFPEAFVEAAAAVLRSGKVNYWTGEEGRAFEQEYAASLGRRHGIALANGTVALELLLRALGIGPGDEVIVPCRTFLASASAVVMVGARPVMADVDSLSQNLTAATARAALTPRTRALIAVHLAGWPCAMDEINAFAREQGLLVIEDCAQAHGARYRDRPAGGWGDAAAFSFCQDKIITTAGEGGLAVCDDDDLFERAWAYKDHGKSYDAVFRREHAPGYRWLHESFGTNWRLTELQAALGRLALAALPEWVATRRHHAATLNVALADVPGLRLTLPPPEVHHSYYKYYCFVQPERLRPGWDRDRIMAAVTAEGIPCYSGSCSEIYLEKAFPPEWRPAQPLPVARELGATSLMLLVHPTLTAADIADTAEALRKVMTVAAE